MHKTLCVAHLDDEIIWFNPQTFDKIIICFLGRHDKKDFHKRRKAVLDQHPLKNKIECLGLIESGYFNCEKRINENRKSFIDVCHELKKHKDTDIVYTHNPWGEYGHTDHILVNQAVRRVFKDKEIICPDFYAKAIKGRTVSGIENFSEDIDIEFYKGVKALYEKEKCWTWHDIYIPEPTQKYFKL